MLILSVEYIINAKSFSKRISEVLTYKPMTIDGVECAGEVCTIGSGKSFAVLNLDDSVNVEYSIVAYDGNWTKGSTDVTTVSAMSPEEAEGLPLLLIGAGVLLLAAVAGFIIWARRPSPA